MGHKYERKCSHLSERREKETKLACQIDGKKKEYQATSKREPPFLSMTVRLTVGTRSLRSSLTNYIVLSKLCLLCLYP